MKKFFLLLLVLTISTTCMSQRYVFNVNSKTRHLPIKGTNNYERSGLCTYLSGTKMIIDLVDKELKKITVYDSGTKKSNIFIVRDYNIETTNGTNIVICYGDIIINRELCWFELRFEKHIQNSYIFSVYNSQKLIDYNISRF
jgi:hypothetical protein